MIKKSQIYKCGKCESLIEVLHDDECTPSCCGGPMNLVKENSIDASKEKHIPVIEKTADGYKITVGSVPHPMEETHFIEFIELLSDSQIHRKYLKPGDKPEANFTINGKIIYAREYCNIHGLWKKEI